MLNTLCRSECSKQTPAMRSHIAEEKKCGKTYIYLLGVKNLETEKKVTLT